MNQVSPAMAAKGWKYLHKTYPVKRGRKAVMIYIDEPFVLCAGKQVGGTSQPLVTKDALAYVAVKGRSIDKVAITMAHEYKHCLQFINEGRTHRPGDDGIDWPLELPAVGFSHEVYKGLVKQMTA